MGGFFSSLMTTLLTLYMSFGGTAAAAAPPEEAATEFLDGLSAGKTTVMEQYLDNEYVNFLINSTGDPEQLNRMRGAIFKNFSYEITDSAARNDIAVVQVVIERDDFSGALDKYTKDSYDYVSNHLYDKQVTDKEKLSAKCLEIYVSDLEKMAGDKPDEEVTLYLPLLSDGYGNWDVALDDKTMKTLLGDLELPTGEEGK